MRLRRATFTDLDFLVELYSDEDVRPHLAGGARYDRETLLDELERLEREPSAGAILLVEVDGEPAAAMKWRLESERNRIAHLGGLAVHPAFRGRHLADDAARLLQRHLIVELGFHRLQLEVYGSNERAMRHAERAGFVREGVKRKAYLRDGEWVDGVIYALVEEDLGLAGTDAEPSGRAVGSARMARYLHTMYRITDPARSRAFYEALGFEFRRDMDIVRDGEREATNYFFGIPGEAEDVLELTFNHDGRTYELGTGYGHIAIGVDDLDAALGQLAEQGIEPERAPYQVREGGNFICFVRDPDDYRVELIGRSGQ